MAYKKHFKSNPMDGSLSPISGATGHGNRSIKNIDVKFSNYQNNLQEVYSGHPNRVDRYNQYEAMDMDSEINACLDIISEFCTQVNEHNGTAFEFEFNEEPTENETKILKQQLKQWIKLNQIDQRIFKMFRNTLKYGDQVFIRDPETFQLYWVEPSKVQRIIVNESEGKKPEQYIIQDINPNFENLSVATKTVNDYQKGIGSGINNSVSFNTNGGQGSAGNTRFATGLNETTIDAKHVVHLSLSEGLDYFWPFGTSVLENIFKVYKQKELLEDAILIYRIQRAPERRVFKIDVGSMPSHMAMSFVERIKNEIHQRRIPTRNGDGQSVMDATYNPLSSLEDYFFPISSEGRGSSVEVLPGGSQLGEIDDLRYFNNKLARGLRVPSSYLPTGPDDQTTPMSDGRVGTALIQEYRFNQYCQRLQQNIITSLDDEFKLFLKFRGFNIDAGIFDLKFNPPQNFASYRQSELDSSRVNTFQTLEGYNYFSKRFLIKRFLGLTEIEMMENDKLWREEHADDLAVEASGGDLRGVGVTPGDISSDLDMADELEGMDMEGEEGEPTDEMDMENEGPPDVNPEEF